MRKLISLSILIASLTVGAQASDIEKTVLSDIYTSIGSNGNYEFGADKVFAGDIIAELWHKKFKDRSISRAAVYSFTAPDLPSLVAVGAGVIRTKVDSHQDSIEIKPTLCASAFYGWFPVALSGYIADANNNGVSATLPLFSQSLNNEWREGMLSTAVSFNTDEIQGDRDNSINFRVTFAF